MTLSLDEAIELIRAKKEATENKVIKTFDEEPDLQVLNGRYGPYIAYKKSNYKIPDDIKPIDLTVESCFRLMDLQNSKPETRKRRYSGKKK